MKNTMKKLFITSLAFALSVTPLSAKTLLGREVPERAYGVFTTTPNYGGTRTAKDIIVKNGIAFVEAKELAKAFNLEVDIDEHGCDFSPTTYGDTESVAYVIVRLRFDETRLLHHTAVKAGDTLFRDYESIFFSSDYKTTYEYRLGKDRLPFKKDGKVYVPAKDTIQAINNNAKTPVTYDAKTKTLTFQDELCVPLVQCIGYHFVDGDLNKYGYVYF